MHIHKGLSKLLFWQRGNGNGSFPHVLYRIMRKIRDERIEERFDDLLVFLDGGGEEVLERRIRRRVGIFTPLAKGFKAINKLV
jgi:hypothetical protein